MSSRRVLRILLSVVLIAMLWLRLSTGMWGVGKVVLTAILLMVIGMEISAAVKKGRRPKDEVPKRPLGL